MVVHGFPNGFPWIFPWQVPHESATSLHSVSRTSTSKSASSIWILLLTMERDGDEKTFGNQEMDG
jgi:hypothetical protein